MQVRAQAPRQREARRPAPQSPHRARQRALVQPELARPRPHRPATARAQVAPLAPARPAPPAPAPPAPGRPAPSGPARWSTSTRRPRWTRARLAGPSRRDTTERHIGQRRHADLGRPGLAWRDPVSRDTAKRHAGQRRRAFVGGAGLVRREPVRGVTAQRHPGQRRRAYLGGPRHAQRDRADRDRLAARREPAGVGSDDQSHFRNLWGWVVGQRHCSRCATQFGRHRWSGLVGQHPPRLGPHERLSRAGETRSPLCTVARGFEQ